MKIGKFVTVGLVIILTVVLLTVPFSGCAKAPKQATLTYCFWSGDLLPLYVPGVLLEEELDYIFDIKEGGSAAFWAALSTGDIDLTTVSLYPNTKEYVEKYADQTKFLGTIYGPFLQSMFIPKWLQEETGIKSIEDLKDPEIAKLFDIDKDGFGDWLGCPQQWACYPLNERAIKAYGLDTLYKQMGGEVEFLTFTIIGQMKKHEPILFYREYPHQIFLDYAIGENLVRLDDPLRSLPDAEVQKYGNREWLAENPKAEALVSQVVMTPEDIMWMMEQVREKGDDRETLTALAKEWMTKNQEMVDSWLEVIK